MIDSANALPIAAEKLLLIDARELARLLSVSFPLGSWHASWVVVAASDGFIRRSSIG